LNAGVDRERIIPSKPAGWRSLRGIAAALAQRLDATLVKGDPDFAGMGDPRGDWLKRACPDRPPAATRAIGGFPTPLHRIGPETFFA
jgi:hypothetical protein